MSLLPSIKLDVALAISDLRAGAESCHPSLSAEQLARASGALTPADPRDQAILAIPSRDPPYIPVLLPCCRFLLLIAMYCCR